MFSKVWKTTESSFEVPVIPGKKGANVTVPFSVFYVSPPQIEVYDRTTGNMVRCITKIVNRGVKLLGVPPGKYHVIARGYVELYAA